jgi:hypothetical protein
MSSADSFHRFSSLPAELRLKVWKNAMPARMLQVGIDFPFPTLFLPPADSQEQYLWAVPCSQPVLFSVCHESRSVCLLEYIPFAYTYLHPSLDSLYISRKAASRLFINAFRQGGIARAPLYPLSMVERIVIEFDGSDLPSRIRSSTSSLVFNTYCRVFEMFGPPRTLILVEGQRWNEHVQPPTVAGWKSLEIVDNHEERPQADKVDRAIEFACKTLEMDAKYNPWLAWRVPKVEFAVIKRIGRFDRGYDYGRNKMTIPLQTMAREWKEDEWALKQRMWDWDKDGNPHSRENMEIALVKHKQKAI